MQTHQNRILRSGLCLVPLRIKCHIRRPLKQASFRGNAQTKFAIVKAGFSTLKIYFASVENDQTSHE